ncbi:hypothetical protein AOXY_G29131 [Acipenser oxyrinchus oxyrinchus]|uniref:A-kinase anchor protein 2 C-terminal domain-containing protein n=1 Tax=Acipenser oxyrinchus oxyrinchus TaxID=40147 RepID=A0AAD8FSA9_ACIOX|nr:hypothetical protein AOXY_G29131 [Acipenser oxyrinchus oxyrinchus]
MATQNTQSSVNTEEDSGSDKERSEMNKAFSTCTAEEGWPGCPDQDGSPNNPPSPESPDVKLPEGSLEDCVSITPQRCLPASTGCQNPTCSQEGASEPRSQSPDDSKGDGAPGIPVPGETPATGNRVPLSELPKMGLEMSEGSTAVLEGKKLEDKGRSVEGCLKAEGNQDENPSDSIPGQAGDSLDSITADLELTRISCKDVKETQLGPFPEATPPAKLGALRDSGHCAVPQDDHKRALLPHSALQQEHKEQVSAELPPLATVVLELANESSLGELSVLESGEGEGLQEGALTGGAKQGAAWEGDAETEKDMRLGSQRPGASLLLPDTREEAAEAPDQPNRSRMEVENGDAASDDMSDSGVSADFSPGSTLELDGTLDLPPANETPIERGIRLAQERENSLRRARGISRPCVSEEYVEIPIRKPILSQPLPAISSKGKDRQFAGLQMKKQIQLETKREEDLVQLGKVLGVYDRGARQELQEKKLLFEQFQEPEQPVSKKLSASTDFLNASPGQSVRERRKSLETLDQNPSADGSHASSWSSSNSSRSSSVSSAPRGPSLAEGPNVIILENTFQLHAATPSYSPQPVPPPSRAINSSQGEKVIILDSENMFSRGNASDEVPAVNGDASPTENPFFKLRASREPQTLVEQDILAARQREQELHRQRYSLYGNEGNQESGKPRIASTNGGHVSRSSPTPSERLAQGKLEVTWPPRQTTTKPSDQSETHRSSRTPGQKIALLQRWEAGLVNGHRDDDE